MYGLSYVWSKRCSALMYDQCCALIYVVLIIATFSLERAIAYITRKLNDRGFDIYYTPQMGIAIISTATQLTVSIIISTV